VGILGLSASSRARLLAEIDRLGTNMLTVEAGRSFTGEDALPLSLEVGAECYTGFSSFLYSRISPG
jgi:hypothetical protein